MNPGLLTTEALVLRNLRFGDTSRVATLFTREAGKLGAIGKGVREPKSPFGASLEVLTLSSFVLYYRPGRDLHLLKSGSVEREFRGILRRPTRYLFASALAEFLDRVLMAEEPAGEIFALALRVLEVLEQAAEPSLPELFRAFQLRVASLLGYAPRLDACDGCGRALPARVSEEGAGDDAPGTGGPAAERPRSRGPSSPDATGLWLFRAREAGVLCPSCAGASEATAARPERSLPEGEEGVRLHPRAVRRLRAMALGVGRAPAETPSAPTALSMATPPEFSASAPTSGVRERAPAPMPSTAWLRLLDRLVEEYLRYHLDSYRGLRSLDALASWEGVLRPRESPSPAD